MKVFFMTKNLWYQEKNLYLQSQTGAVAQMVEQWTENPCVGSSILPSTTEPADFQRVLFLFTLLFTLFDLSTRIIILLYCPFSISNKGLFFGTVLTQASCVHQIYNYKFNDFCRKVLLNCTVFYQHTFSLESKIGLQCIGRPNVLELWGLELFGCQLNMHYPTTVFVTPFTTEYICLLQESNIAINRCDGLFEVGLDFFGSYFIIALDNGNDFFLSIS